MKKQFLAAKERFVRENNERQLAEAADKYIQENKKPETRQPNPKVESELKKRSVLRQGIAYFNTFKAKLKPKLKAAAEPSSMKKPANGLF